MSMSATGSAAPAFPSRFGNSLSVDPVRVFQQWLPKKRQLYQSLPLAWQILPMFPIVGLIVMLHFRHWESWLLTWHLKVHLLQQKQTQLQLQSQVLSPSSDCGLALAKCVHSCTGIWDKEWTLVKRRLSKEKCYCLPRPIP